MSRVLIMDDNVLMVFSSGFGIFDDEILYGGDTVTQVTTPEDFLEALYNQGPWDRVWLDHDLGLDLYADGRARNGKTATLAIQEKFFVDGIQPPAAEYSVVSMNSTRATEMADDLRATGANAALMSWSSLENMGMCRGDRCIGAPPRTWTITNRPARK